MVLQQSRWRAPAPPDAKLPSCPPSMAEQHPACAQQGKLEKGRDASSALRTISAHSGPQPRSAAPTNSSQRLQEPSAYGTASTPKASTIGLQETASALQHSSSKQPAVQPHPLLQTTKHMFPAILLPSPVPQIPGQLASACRKAARHARQISKQILWQSTAQLPLLQPAWPLQALSCILQT